jgi:hypothetical protein
MKAVERAARTEKTSLFRLLRAADTTDTFGRVSLRSWCLLRKGSEESDESMCELRTTNGEREEGRRSSGCSLLLSALFRRLTENGKDANQDLISHSEGVKTPVSHYYAIINQLISTCNTRPNPIFLYPILL